MQSRKEFIEDIADNYNDMTRGDLQAVIEARCMQTNEDEEMLFKEIEKAAKKVYIFRETYEDKQAIVCYTDYKKKNMYWAIYINEEDKIYSSEILFNKLEHLNALGYDIIFKYDNAIIPECLEEVL